MEFSHKRLQSFPMVEPTSQAILKIIQLECVDMSDPFEIVDLCLHWKNSWRRSSILGRIVRADMRTAWCRYSQMIERKH